MRVRSLLPTFKVFAQLIGVGVVLSCLAGLEYAAVGFGPRVFAFTNLFAFLGNLWAIYAYYRYREGRQDELYQVLLAAVEREVPLAPAIQSYLYDRPGIISSPDTRQTVRRVIDVVFMVALPLYGYSRLCLGFRSFDQTVEQLADRLEMGESLSDALRRSPGAACREVRLAAEVGEETGTLAICLKNANRERWSAAWLEIAPRLLYPFAILLFVMGITTFLMTFIIPRFQRIFSEFGEKLPYGTRVLVDLWNSNEDLLILEPLFVLVLIFVIAIVVANPGIRWYTPIIGRLYRSGIQGEILRTLGRLLTAGRTVPQALDLLTRSGVLPRAIVRRVTVASQAVERGEPLNDALDGAGLLPASMSPLINASERVGTLPWALTELGSHLAGRAYQLVRRLSLVVAPILVVLVGLLVGFIALSMFLPLIHLLTRLAE